MKHDSSYGPALTDVAGEKANATQLERLANRYRWATELCNERRVLDAACGTGQGLNLLATTAAFLIGADRSGANLSVAKSTYDRRIPLAAFDTQALPIVDEALDAVVLLETLYFLPSPERCLSEIHRVLRPQGKVLISVINRDTSGYDPNPLYSQHFGVIELCDVLVRCGFTVSCFGAIPLNHPSMRHRLFRPLKRLATRFALIPKTMRGRQWIKRVVFGKLVAIPFKLSFDSARYNAPLAIPCDQPNQTHQVILCAGTKR